MLSFSELARDAGMAVETARRYIEYLRLSYQAFLLQTSRGILAIEVKGRESVTGSDFRSLKRVAKELGERWLGGLVLYRGREIYELEPGFWAVPSYRFFGG